MNVLNDQTRALRVGVYKIYFTFLTKDSNMHESIYLNIDSPKRISHIEHFLFEEVVETYKEGYPEVYIKKGDITEKPIIKKIKFKPEFFYAKL